MTLREHILSDIRDEWRQIASQPDDHKTMGTPPDDLTIFEYSQADIPDAACAGPGSPVESMDRQQRTISALFAEPPRQVHYRGAYWPHAHARFYIAPDSSVAVLELIFGPRFGGGYRYTPNPNGGYFRDRVWVS